MGILLGSEMDVCGRGRRGIGRNTARRENLLGRPVDEILDGFAEAHGSEQAKEGQTREHKRKKKDASERFTLTSFLNKFSNKN